MPQTSAHDVNPQGRDILFFDGVCKYCWSVVKAAFAADPEKRFLFSPLQSDFAQKALGYYGIDSLALRSIYVITKHGTSEEAIRAAAPASNYLLLRLSGELRRIGEENSRKTRDEQDAEYQDVTDHRYERYGKYDHVQAAPEQLRERYIP
jgi:predicted DCC family thiol-disulfide oxidoreductase YuxK